MLETTKSLTQFYIKSSNLIYQNQLFLDFKHKKTTKTKLLKTTKTKTKKSINKINLINRKVLLENEVPLDKQLREPIKIVNNTTGEIIELSSYNKINTFNKNLLDNRFIGLVLVNEWVNDGLLITLTTPPLNDIDNEINNLEVSLKQIKRLLERKKVKYIVSYELTKQLVPHIHILVEKQEYKKDIEEILKKSVNQNQLLSIPKYDLEKVVYYITKNCEYENQKVLMGFEKKLKENKRKLFISSKTKKFTKKSRSPLYSAYMIHIKYNGVKDKYLSNDFMNFCFNYVKEPLKGYNTHLTSETPHFIIKGVQVIHSSGLRVFSQFTRVDNNGKKSIIKTHKKIVEYSKLLLQEIKIVKRFIIGKIKINKKYFKIDTNILFKIIIIKPPPKPPPIDKCINVKLSYKNDNL